MNKNKRHEEILTRLQNATKPLSATSLANNTNVSRQLIVGDIALLRASGHDIVATHKGYLLNPKHKQYSQQIVFKHNPEDTQVELEILVNHNCSIKDVIIEHPSYGSITGELNINTLEDVHNFINQNNPLISILTDGIHIHTIEYDQQSDLDEALKELKNKQFLYE